MPIYKGTTEITKLSDLLTATEHDIQYVYFGGKEVFTIWDTYDGTLPAQFSANGGNLKAYKVWGNIGGVGTDSGTAYGYEVDIKTKTSQLFDYNTMNNGGDNQFLRSNGTVTSQSGWHITTYIPCDGIEFTLRVFTGGIIASICLYDENKVFLVGKQYDGKSEIVISSQTPAKFIRFSALNSWNAAQINLIEGASAPIEPIPYISITTPIYIGTPALEKDEYVDSVSGKVYRRTEQLFDGQWLQGYYAQSGGAYVEYSTWICFKNKIPCKPNTDYTLKYFANSRYYSIGWYTENDTYISMATSTVSGEGVAVLTATSPANAAYLACSVAGYPSSSSRIAPEDAANTVLIEGSTAPSTHIPYLQPVDPPAPLPQLPTINGSTIIEVDSTVQPEKVSLTYRKEDF